MIIIIINNNNNNDDDNNNISISVIIIVIAGMGFRGKSEWRNITPNALTFFCREDFTDLFTIHGIALH